MLIEKSSRKPRIMVFWVLSVKMLVFTQIYLNACLTISSSEHLQFFNDFLVSVIYNVLRCLNIIFFYLSASELVLIGSCIKI